MQERWSGWRRICSKLWLVFKCLLLLLLLVLLLLVLRPEGYEEQQAT